MKDIIQHDGIVDSIEGEHVLVRIVQQAACSACKARELCISSESKEKVIDVIDSEAAKTCKVGEKVTVCGALSMGKMAVRLAFGVPLALIVVIIPIALKLLNWGEFASVGAATVVLAAYYYGLYLNREQMTKRFAFWIQN